MLNPIQCQKCDSTKIQVNRFSITKSGKRTTTSTYICKVCGATEVKTNEGTDFNSSFKT